MPMKYYSVILVIIIIFYATILRLPAAIAEEPTGNTQQHVTAENPVENRQPSITRNPFVNAPYGRMNKTPPGAGTNTSSGKINKDSEDVPLKSLRLRGVLISNDKSAALLNHKIVGMGDMIGDYKITEIADKGVTLSNGDIVIRLTIE